MPHPYASDPTLDPILRRAFGQVTCQIVRTFDDGSEGIINMANRAKAEAELPHYRARIGRTFGGPDNGGGLPKVLLAVEIRDVAR